MQSVYPSSAYGVEALLDTMNISGTRYASPGIIYIYIYIYTLRLTGNNIYIHIYGADTADAPRVYDQAR